MKRSIFAVTLAAVSLCTPAVAADTSMPVKGPALDVADWSGFYAGLHVGYGWGRDPFEEPFFPNFSLNGISSNGFVAGGHFGYNRQFGSLVGGLEVDISSTEIKGSTSGAAFRTFSPFGGLLETDAVTASREDKFDLLGSARGRLGFLPMPNWLLYATGGPAWTQFTQDNSVTQASLLTGVFTGVGISTTSNSIPSWRFGWAAGAGLEAKLFNSNWLVRLEYLHYDFGMSEPSRASSSTFIQSGVTTTSSSTSTAGRLTADVVRTGVSYKF